MRLVLDTNRYTDLSTPIDEVADTIAEADEVFIPFVVLAELYYGFRKGSRRQANERKLREFLAQPSVRPLFPDQKTVELCADLRMQLHRQGTPIPPHDLWIAALTLQHGLTLYARDKHFDHLPQLARV